MNNTTAPTRRRLGFTIVELLAVIAIIVAIATFLLPAFTRIVESSNIASAINSVSVTLGNARARAVLTGRPTGVIFLFDAAEERYTLVVAEAASLQGGVLTNGVSRADIYAQGFRPVINSVPVALPRRTGVFALPRLPAFGSEADVLIENGTSGARTWQWYAGELINGDNGTPDDEIRLWLFPRNDPRLFSPELSGETIGQDPWLRLLDPSNAMPSPTVTTRDAIEAIRNASTFMVLFAADGTVQETDRSGGREYLNFFLEYADEPFDTSSTERTPYDDENRFDPENFGRPQVPEGRRRRNAEAMIRTVNQIAVIDLKKLDSGVGFPRAWLVRAESSRTPQPQWLTDEATNRAVDYVDNERARAVSRWIDRNGEIIGFNRYTGSVIRRRAQ